jgi:ferrous iron transport protein A
VFKSVQATSLRQMPAGEPVVAPLGRGARGFRGVVSAIGPAHRRPGGLDQAELERRLLEIGFVEGASVEILHEGALGGDPIAVKLDDMRVALRRREADAVMVTVEAGALRAGRAGRAA